MYVQRNLNTVIGYFRPNRKCFSLNGSLLFLLILMLGIAQQTFARPNQVGDLTTEFSVDDDFNNLKIHHAHMVDKVDQKDHPIIIYKEDFVDGDYVSFKNESKHKRRYKDISQRRRHRPNFTDVVINEKPEKILFDIIPEKPLIVPEDMEKPRRSHIKLVPLIDDISETKDSNEQTSFKGRLNKRPKKFHRRIRRDIFRDHIVHKRNPYFRHSPKIIPDIPTHVQYIYVKHSVPGKKHNGLDIPIRGPTPTLGPATPTDNMPISFDNRVAADENDRVIFSGSKTTSRPTSRPIESIFRDPRPENFDFSFMNRQRQRTTTVQPQNSVGRPTTFRPQEGIFRDPNPENFDWSFMNKRQENSAARPQPTEAGISQCVWAIVNCCSNRNSDIRYSCFEQNGCYGAFWGLNPCADNVRDSLINYVADYYN